MPKDDRSYGVSVNALKQGIACGAYPSIEAAVERLETECPSDGLPQHVVALSRMILVNQDIDRALFREARETNGWTWLNDFGVVFVLMGNEEQGFILQERLNKAVPFDLELQNRPSGMRFLKFLGDKKSERSNLKTNGQKTPLECLAEKMFMGPSKARDIFEALIRTCDEGGWERETFPVVYQGRKLPRPHRLLFKHKLLVIDPFGVHRSHH